jgi:hypothetical protein
LKMRSNHSSRSLGTLCKKNWMGDDHERWLWRGMGSGMVSQRSLSSRELQQPGVWWSEAPLPSLARRKSHCLRVMMGTKHRACGWHCVGPPRLPPGCLSWLLSGSEGREPKPSKSCNIHSLLSPKLI